MQHILLQPHSEHLIDWFHITMRVTVMQQQAKALQEERPETETGADVSKRLNSVKHLLWHGNTEEALERVRDLTMDLSLIEAHSGAAKRLGNNVSEFQTYIENNQEYIPNYGELYRQGDTITTSFVESAINQVVSKRFVKKQSAVDTARCASAAAGTNEGFKWGTGRGISALVSTLPAKTPTGRRAEGRLTPDFFARSKIQRGVIATWNKSMKKLHRT